MFPSTINRADFTLGLPTQTFNLEGVVTATGGCVGYTLVEEAEIIVSYSPGADLSVFFSVTTTDQNGRYSFSGLPQHDSFRMVIVPPGHLKIQTINGIDGTQGDVTLDVIIPCGSAISGTITTTVSANVVYVMLYDENDRFMDYTVADSNGHYAFYGLSDAVMYKVVAAAAGNATKWFDLDGDGDDIGSADLIDASIAPANIDILLRAE